MTTTNDGISALAAMFPCGELRMATDPGDFLTEIAAEIGRMRVANAEQSEALETARAEIVALKATVAVEYENAESADRELREANAELRAARAEIVTLRGALVEEETAAEVLADALAYVQVEMDDDNRPVCVECMSFLSGDNAGCADGCGTGTALDAHHERRKPGEKEKAGG